jgi:hypothetical protein
LKREEFDINMLTLFITLLNHIPPIPNFGTPPLDAVIDKGTIFKE